MDRYKDMQDGEYIDGIFVEYEDMTEDQLMDIFADEAETWQKEYHAQWLEDIEEE